MSGVEYIDPAKTVSLSKHTPKSYGKEDPVMNKKLFAVFAAMALMTALVAAVMIGCGREKTPAANGSGTSAGTSAGVSDGTTEGQQIEYVAVTLESGENSETILIGGGVSADRPDDTSTQEPKPTEKPVENESGFDPILPSGKPDLSVTYEQYLAMSGAEQTAYFKAFGEGDEGALAFVAWFDKAKEAWTKENQAIIATGDGNLDLNDYTTP